MTEYKVEEPPPLDALRDMDEEEETADSSGILDMPDLQLAKLRAALDLTNDFGDTALSLAKKSEIVGILATMGAGGYTPLLCAVAKMDVEAVRKLCEVPEVLNETCTFPTVAEALSDGFDAGSTVPYANMWLEARKKAEKIEDKEKRRKILDRISAQTTFLNAITAHGESAFDILQRKAKDAAVGRLEKIEKIEKILRQSGAGGSTLLVASLLTLPPATSGASTVEFWKNQAENTRKQRKGERGVQSRGRAPGAQKQPVTIFDDVDGQGKYAYVVNADYCVSLPLSLSAFTSFPFSSPTPFSLSLSLPLPLSPSISLTSRRRYEIVADEMTKSALAKAGAFGFTPVMHHANEGDLDGVKMCVAADIPLQRGDIVYIRKSFLGKRPRETSGSDPYTHKKAFVVGHRDGGNGALVDLVVDWEGIDHYICGVDPVR